MSPETLPPETPGLLDEKRRIHLRRILLAHVCRDTKEAADRDAIVHFIEHHDDALRRTNRTGHVVGSAFVVDWSRRRVLLTHHRKLGRWLQLGGHAEAEWEPSAVAVREACEESGLTDLVFHPCCAPTDPHGPIRPFDLDIHEIPAHGDEPAHLHLDVRYVLIAPPEASGIGDIRPPTDESIELRWFTLDEALALPHDASLHRALLALREALMRRRPAHA